MTARLTIVGSEFEKISSVKATVKENKLAKFQNDDNEIKGVKTTTKNEEFGED